MIEESLRRNKAGRSILIDENNESLAGEGTTRSAIEAGIKEVIIVETTGDQLVAVKRTDLSENAKAEMVMFDNRATDTSGWDNTKTAEMLAKIRDAGTELSVFGYTDADLKKFQAKTQDEESLNSSEISFDKGAELNKKWKVQKNDVWVIGNHRLLCGDASDRTNLNRLMNGQIVQLVMTSPPYADQRKTQYGGIPEDKYWAWFQKIQKEIQEILHETGVFILNIKPHARASQRSLYVFDLVTSMVRQEGWLFVDEFVWLRTGIPQQVVNRFKNAFEPCYWFARSEKFAWYPAQVQHKSKVVPLALGKGGGDQVTASKEQGKGGGAIQKNEIVEGWAYPSNVLNFKQNADALGHSAAFPVQLPSFFIEAMTLEGQSVYDPFAGSGTTMVASQSLGRACYSVEMKPEHCAIILERMVNTFGCKPIKEKG